MRILLIDIDSLRPDHLGCYGYRRPTSPVIDALAAEGVRFENCFVSDAPCLPSRTAWASGRFGIHNGVVAHGGVRAEPFGTSADRVQDPAPDTLHWFHALAEAGYHTASVSPFATRHAAWWYLAGLREWHDTGKGGLESAEEINAVALPWLERHARQDDWVLHVNYWDPHTPYRAPTYPEVHAAPAPDWVTQAVLDAHWERFGTMSAQDPMAHWFPEAVRHQRPGVPAQLRATDDWRAWIDGYDDGVHHADRHVGALIDVLRAKGVLDETVVVVTADHGENQGELNIYGDHQTADVPTCRVPFIVRYPELGEARVDRALHYQFDLGATLLELAGATVPAAWDARGFVGAFRDGGEEGRDHLVLSQMAWSCQRSVRFGDWLYLRTYDPGLKDLRPELLFDVTADPHQQHDLAELRPEVVAHARARLLDWHDTMMATSLEPVDPLQQVMREGGPSLARGRLPDYLHHLESTGRAAIAARLRDDPWWR